MLISESLDKYIRQWTGSKLWEPKPLFLLLNQYGLVDPTVNWIKIQVPKVFYLSIFHCNWTAFSPKACMYVLPFQLHHVHLSVFCSFAQDVLWAQILLLPFRHADLSLLARNAENSDLFPLFLLPTYLFPSLHSFIFCFPKNGRGKFFVPPSF